MYKTHDTNELKICNISGIGTHLQTAQLQTVWSCYLYDTHS